MDNFVKFNFIKLFLDIFYLMYDIIMILLNSILFNV